MGQTVKLIYTAQLVEIYHDHQRIVVYERQAMPHHYTTRPEHLPNHQQWVGQWSSEYFLQQATQVGPHTRLALEELLQSRSYPQQAYRSCAGILSLAPKVGNPRLENACERAVAYGTISFKLIRSILERELDRLPLTQPSEHPLPTHENIRGAGAYQ